MKFGNKAASISGQFFFVLCRLITFGNLVNCWELSCVEVVIKLVPRVVKRRDPGDEVVLLLWAFRLTTSTRLSMNTIFQI